MDLDRALSISAAGMAAQSTRLRVVAENIANRDSTGQSPGADPYRRKIVTFQGKLDRELDAQVVELGRVSRDRSDFRNKYDPGHPAADASGQVKLPNVNSLVETMDMREAQRSYEANLNVISSTRRMIQRTIDILRA